MLFLALDTSKSRTGWALWETGAPKPRIGHFKCGNEFSSDGMCQDALWRNLSDICSFGIPDIMAVEKAANPKRINHPTNWDQTMTLVSLTKCAEFFAHNKRVGRFSQVPKDIWFPHFIGTHERPPKGKSKSYCEQQCLDLGIQTTCDDEADAVGILDYIIHLEGILPPWRNENVLTRELGR